MQRPDLHPYFIEIGQKSLALGLSILARGSNDATAVTLGFALNSRGLIKLL